MDDGTSGPASVVEVVGVEVDPLGRKVRARIRRPEPHPARLALTARSLGPWPCASAEGRERVRVRYPEATAMILAVNWRLQATRARKAAELSARARAPSTEACWATLLPTSRVLAAPWRRMADARARRASSTDRSDGSDGEDDLGAETGGSARSSVPREDPSASPETPERSADAGCEDVRAPGAAISSSGGCSDSLSALS